MGRRPSPATVISIIALVFAVAGTAAAGVATVSVLSKKEKKQTRHIAVSEIGKAAPGLSVKHAASADTAGHAGTADVAAPTGDAGGELAGSYPNPMIGAGTPGVAQAGANVAANGTLQSFFNRAGGAPTVAHQAGSGAYDLTFPGLSLTPTNHVVLATLANGGAIIRAGASATVTGAVHVLVQNTSLVNTDGSFNVAVFPASTPD